MRQAINNLQSTWSGFGFISSENVFKVCDQPHPIVIQAILEACQKSDIDTAMEKIQELWDQGYSAVDVVVTIFRVVKASEKMPEYTKLEFIKVRCAVALTRESAERRAARKLGGPICASWKAWGLLSNWVASWLVSVKWSVVLPLCSFYGYQTEYDRNSTGDEARAVSDIKKHLANDLEFQISYHLPFHCCYHISLSVT